LNKGIHNLEDKSQARVAVFLVIFLIWMLQQFLLMAYRIKSPWYHPTFWPPEHYGVGSLLEDQGNNI